MCQEVSYCFAGPGFLYHQTKGMILPQPIESMRRCVLGRVCIGSRVVGSLCAFLKVSFTGPFLEASANRVNDFEPKKLKKPKQGHQPNSLSQHGLLLLSPSCPDWNTLWTHHKGKFKRAQAGQRRVWSNLEKSREETGMGVGIWSPMTNTSENSGFSHLSVATKIKKYVFLSAPYTFI